jgi:hypothetical protein
MGKAINITGHVIMNTDVYSVSKKLLLYGTNYKHIMRHKIHPNGGDKMYKGVVG